LPNGSFSQKTKKKGLSDIVYDEELDRETTGNFHEAHLGSPLEPWSVVNAPCAEEGILQISP
jgi:hypothetical protein